jgi:hypothetical protein
METVTLEISNPVILSALANAARRGVPAESYLLGLVETSILSQQATPPTTSQALTAEEIRAAEVRLFAFSGVVRGNDPNCGDNEKIDADLARAYGDDHLALYQSQT